MKVDDRKFVNAYYPWNEELAREAKADTPHHEPIKEKLVETAAFEYSIEIACTLDELNTYQVGAFFLGKTKEEESISLWTKSQTDKGFSLLTASVKVNEPKSLTREFFISSGHCLTFNDVSPVKKGSGTHAKSFVPIKPSIQIYDRLAWPKVGFFYHFINDELENEYPLSGGDKWSFKVTYSKGKVLSSDLLSEHEYAFILLPWKINNTVISRQHLLYTKEKMTQEQLSEINAQWLDESACLINPDEVVTARSDKIVMREQEDNGRITYTVQSGDTFGLIAKKQGITYNGLLTLNPQITNPDLIQVGDVVTIKDTPPEQESIQFHVCKIKSETGQRETWGEIAEQHGMGAKELYDLNADNPMHKDGALALDNELRVKNTAQSEAPDVVYRNAQSPEDVSGDKWVFSFANVWSVIEKPFSDVAHMFVQDDTALNKNTSVIKVNSIRLHSKILSDSDGLEAIAQEKKGAIKKGDKDAPKSNEIKTIQEALLTLNFDLGKYGADGDFGSGTEQAVIDFQREFVPTHEVHPEYEMKKSDGVVGNQTLLALDEAVTIKWKYVRKCKLMIDHHFIQLLEGTKKEGYVPMPDKSQSGVTIGSGFDLGARNVNDLISMGLPESLVEKFTPYLGLKKYEAVNKLKALPLSLTEADLSIVEATVKKSETDKIIKLFNSSSKVKFECLPANAQTVVASVAYQYGYLPRRAEKFWEQAINQDWNGMYDNLMAFGDDFEVRRHKEAKLIKEIL